MPELRIDSLGLTKLVSENVEKPCCGSCIDEADEGYGDARFKDYCCCVHGEVFAYKWPDRTEWVDDTAERRYAELDRAES